MKLTLYHYVHCPYCLRVRMTLGYLGLPYESKVLAYDDELTPVNLIGKKMLPIMTIDGRSMGESLDIMAAIDLKGSLKILELQGNSDFLHFSELLGKLSTNIHNLAMPYWIYTSEFNEKTRHYFQSKKEEKRGPFKELVRNRDAYTKVLTSDLYKMSEKLHPFYNSDKFGLYDILLASHLWGLYIVPEFQFSEKIHNYLQDIKTICHFNYHADFWK